MRSGRRVRSKLKPFRRPREAKQEFLCGGLFVFRAEPPSCRFVSRLLLVALTRA